MGLWKDGSLKGWVFERMGSKMRVSQAIWIMTSIWIQSELQGSLCLNARNFSITMLFHKSCPIPNTLMYFRMCWLGLGHRMIVHDIKSHCSLIFIHKPTLWGWHECNTHNWLVVWNLFLFSHILGIIIPIDSYFSEGFKSPTRSIDYP